MREIKYEKVMKERCEECEGFVRRGEMRKMSGVEV